MPAPTKPWWRVDVDAEASDKLVRLPSDSARWAWFTMGCKAKTQRHMGVFSDSAYLRFSLGSYARFLPALERMGLVHEWPTECPDCVEDYASLATGGSMVVHNYRRKQVDPTAADRQARFRDRHGGSHADSDAGRNGVSNAISRAMSPSTSLSVTNEEEDGYQVVPPAVAVPDVANDLRALAEELTRQPNVLANVWGGLGAKAVRLAQKHGLPAVEREWRRIAAEEGGMPELRQLVLGADNALNAVRQGRPETAEERDRRETEELRALAHRNLAAGTPGAPR